MLFMVFLLFAGPSAEAPAPLVCEFQTQTLNDVTGQKVEEEKWLFFRQDNRVEKRDLAATWLHIWEMTPQGVRFSRLKKGHLIVHLPKDLEVLGHRISWEKVTHLIPGKTWLAQLKETGKDQIAARNVTRYEGVVGDARYTVFWSDELALPLRLVKQKNGRTETTLATNIWQLNQAPHKPTLPGAHPIIEFSDEGDNEWLH